MNRNSPVSRINRVPVVFRSASSCAGISFLPLAEITPIYPLTSVYVSASGDRQLRRVASDIADSLADCVSLWPSREDLLLHIYTHILTNVVAHHVSGHWLASDSSWMDEQCIAPKGVVEAEASRDAEVPHVADIVLLGRYSLRLLSASNGRLEVIE